MADPAAFAGKIMLASAAMLRRRARELRTEAGRRAAQWQRPDADMVSRELDRQATLLEQIRLQALLDHYEDGR